MYSVLLGLVYLVCTRPHRHHLELRNKEYLSIHPSNQPATQPASHPSIQHSVHFVYLSNNPKMLPLVSGARPDNVKAFLRVKVRLFKLTFHHQTVIDGNIRYSCAVEQFDDYRSIPRVVQTWLCLCLFPVGLRMNRSPFTVAAYTTFSAALFHLYIYITVLKSIYEIFSQILSHVEKDCPLTMISCPYAEMGCTAKVMGRFQEWHNFCTSEAHATQQSVFVVSHRLISALVLKPHRDYKMYTVEPLHNGHLRYRRKGPLWRGGCYGEVGV